MRWWMLLIVAALSLGRGGATAVIDTHQPGRHLLQRPTSIGKRVPGGGTQAPTSSPSQVPQPEAASGQALPPPPSPATALPALPPARELAPPPSATSGPTPGPQPAPSTNVSSPGGCPDAQAILKAHNDERGKVGAMPLTWSPDLAAAARTWANNCQLQPSGQGYGENLGSGSAWRTCTAAVPLWLSRKSSYTPGGNPPPGALSWTQVVWKGTTELGCGLAQCPSLGGLVVCFYNPPGNVQGQFQANVGQA